MDGDLNGGSAGKAASVASHAGIDFRTANDDVADNNTGWPMNDDANQHKAAEVFDLNWYGVRPGRNHGVCVRALLGLDLSEPTEPSLFPLGPDAWGGLECLGLWPPEPEPDTPNSSDGPEQPPPPVGNQAPKP